jgi:pimeloyl-ACP methyl ester carboxylesterase
MNATNSNHFFSVHKLCNGKQNFTFTFIPGGPGFTSNCFEKFAKKYLSEYKVLAFDSTGNRKPKLSLWVKDLESALKQYPTDIVIGHSFGGMLALSSKNLPSLAKGLVLLNSAPNSNWKKNLGKFKFTKLETEEMKTALKAFKSNRSKKNLQKLWASWAPYYFNRKNLKFGKRWLSKQEYIVKSFGSSEKLLNNYKIKNPLKTKTLIVAGSKDKLTPISGFRISGFLKSGLVDFHQLPNCSHFPWLENPKALASSLITFRHQIDKAIG